MMTTTACTKHSPSIERCETQSDLGCCTREDVGRAGDEPVGLDDEKLRLDCRGEL